MAVILFLPFVWGIPYIEYDLCVGLEQTQCGELSHCGWDWEVNSCILLSEEIDLCYGLEPDVCAQNAPYCWWYSEQCRRDCSIRTEVQCVLYCYMVTPLEDYYEVPPRGQQKKTMFLLSDCPNACVHGGRARCFCVHCCYFAPPMRVNFSLCVH